MYLLDTHVLLWWLSDNALLNDSAREQIANPNYPIFVSSVSAWEIAIKKALGKLEMPNKLEEILSTNGFQPLPIHLEHAHAVGSLPHHHADLFDRMLIAQSQVENLTLITHDSMFKIYGIKLLLC